MTISAGTRLGPYEIVSRIGAGGMGEVWRAKDTRLDRSVAIKILPPEFADDAQLKVRFEHEARTISQLEHPHICRLYDVGFSGGADVLVGTAPPEGGAAARRIAGEDAGAPLSYLVMELLEGETLAERLARGPIPVSEVLRYGVQIADALAQAHRHGIVHRDLKPGNVMLTKSGAKLLDFGLAKSSMIAVNADGATVQKPLTQEGAILGTFQYMAPEQLEGANADARTDIFALGTVLYEMATGKRAFTGANKTSLIASIVAADPKPLSEVQPLAPAALEHVIRKCLEKDPDHRWQSAHDIAEELRWISEVGSRAGTAVTGARLRRRAAWPLLALLSALLAIAATIAVQQYRRAEKASSPKRLSLVLPEKSSLRGMAIDPAGASVAFVLRDGEGRTRLWLRRLDSLAATPLEGTENAAYPFWSPDGKSIGFFANGFLKKVAVSGGPAQTLAPIRIGRGGAWNRDGVIVFAADAVNPLDRIAAGGGKVERLTTFDATRGESTHRWPVFLPDGEHFLCLIGSFGSGGQTDRFGIYAVSMKTGEQTLLVNANSNAAYVEPGYLLYTKGRTLVAQRFDAKRLALAGDPFPVADDVHYFPQVFFAQFDASPNGVVMFQPSTSAVRTQFVWVDRSGKEIGRAGSPGYVENGRISPDGKRIVFDATDPQSANTDLYIADESGSVQRLTFDAAEEFGPFWTPDGKEILYTSVRGSGTQMFRRRATGGASDVAFYPNVKRAIVIDVSDDGRTLVWDASQLFLGSVDGSRPLTEILRSPIVDARISPDGRWLAYSSSESGGPQVYVMSTAGAAAGRWQVSAGGGNEPRWRGDGAELFYLAPDQTMMSVAISMKDGFVPSVPKPLFRFRIREPVSGSDVVSYDVTRDGQRFLINTDVDTGPAPPVHVILNWPREVGR